MSGICGINGNGYYDWGREACFSLPNSAVPTDLTTNKKAVPTNLRNEMSANKAQNNKKVCRIYDIPLPIKDAEGSQSKKGPVPNQPDLKRIDTNGDGKLKLPIHFGKEVGPRDRQSINNIMDYIFHLIPQGILRKILYGQKGPLKISIESSSNLSSATRSYVKNKKANGLYGIHNNEIFVFSDICQSLQNEQGGKAQNFALWCMVTGMVHEIGHAVYFNAALRPSHWTEEIPIIGIIHKYRNDGQPFFRKLFGLYPKPPSFLSYPNGLPNGEELFADSFTYWAYLKVHGKTIDYQKAVRIFPQRSCGGAAAETLYVMDRFLESDGKDTFFKNWRGRD